jgi:NAD(P)-dependent dehydrogenase (short-subunit alcohol dehydrogenase family)
MDIDSPPDLTDTTVIVTGASSGIGASLAETLAVRGAHVVLAVRDTDKGRHVADHINSALKAVGGSGSCEVRRLDLADLASVRQFAEQWTAPLDLLINNAGLSTKTRQTTVDGFELQFGTNHLGHFALTVLLLAHLEARHGRVVTLASQAERAGRLDFDDLNWERRDYKGSRAYNASKLANLLFTAGLQRRLDEAGIPVRAMAAHPGFVRTAIYTESTSAAARLSLKLLAQDAGAGALPVLYAATADLPGNTFTGPERMAHMRGGAETIKRSKAARDVELADRLWQVSAELTGVPAALTPA